jgi:hypothetical protein
MLISYTRLEIKFYAWQFEENVFTRLNAKHI